MTVEKEDLGPCPLCERPLVEGATIDRHHLVPKSEHGKHTRSELCHVVCHRKIHSTISEKELASHYHTWERIREHPHVRRFVNWVQKKHPEFIDTHLDTKERNWRRRR